MQQDVAALEALGFGPWFQERLDPDLARDLQIARVAAVDRDACLVHSGRREVQAQLTGRMQWAADSPLDYPCVGDWAYVQMLDQVSFAVLHAVLPRRTHLQRKTAGKKIDFQLIAANVDVAFVVQALGEDFNLPRLERYLVMANQGGVEPVVLLSKSDLFPPGESAAKAEQMRAVLPGVPVLVFSNQSGQGLSDILGMMNPGQTYCLLGSSGVGKTSLINRILGQEAFATRTVRLKDEKGRHTTSRRYLLPLASGAMLIDTPGMRELGSLAVEEGINETFEDIQDLARACRFRDCTHSQERGCAVMAALREGGLSPERYQSYLKLTRESLHNQMSYYEKRQKDKSFSRMVKSVMKDKGKGKR
eukprot:TRINITY_DN3762_c0_g2_i1.p1 TRINITY_DN3762_c0_g2~~TRINITY_DN3762_c0_g2_i1.p1  ORF type:complete len:362 (+),score=105.19 TRINITY_DN3762_c0_g2_i1:487-1572(+)